MPSKWDGQACPMCAKGTLHDGVKTISQIYKGHTFTSKISGAFCDQCSDGFAESDDKEETAWAAFRDQVDAADVAHGPAQFLLGPK